VKKVKVLKNQEAECSTMLENACCLFAFLFAFLLAQCCALELKSVNAKFKMNNQNIK
jgi:hypothetical protein